MIRLLALAPLVLAGVGLLLITKFPTSSVDAFHTTIGPTKTYYSRAPTVFANNRKNHYASSKLIESPDRLSQQQQQQQQRQSRSRRELFKSSLVVVATTFTTQQAPTTTANALVKGNAPPSSMKPATGSTNKPKCTNIEECQALAELKQEEERQAAQANQRPVQKTPGGVMYRDEILPSSPENDNNNNNDDGTTTTTVAKDGDDVTLFYKVLKLGKRSFDGLSGEGTVVFSRGYGLEDDEKKPGDKVFQTTVGAYSNIAALNEALVGMRVGGVRRVVVLPQKGWRKPTAMCDGGPGGEGRGGDLKTDYVLVPTATMVEQEACFDTSRQPFPATYPQQRRMAQRFDQSLIMEIELRSIAASSTQ